MEKKKEVGKAKAGKRVRKSREVEALKSYVTKLLAEQGLYQKEMCYQVELLASDLVVFRRIRDEAVKAETSLLLTETSREGEARSKENPIFVMMARYADRVRKDLRSLLMNREIQPGDDVKLKDDDPLTALMNDLSKEEEL